MGWVPFALLMNVPLKRLVALVLVETIALTPFAAVTVDAETFRVPVETLFKTLYKFVARVLLVIVIEPVAAFRMHSLPDATVPEVITQLSIETCPPELFNIVNELYVEVVLLIVDDDINTLPVEVFLMRQVLLSDEPPEITQVVNRKLPVEVLCNSTRPEFIDEHPVIDNSPMPLLEIVANVVDVRSDIVAQFIEIVSVEDDVSNVALDVVDPAKVEEFIVHAPVDALKTPPAAADVPPPTNDAVTDAFVMSATSTFWSMVTVKLLA